MAPLNSYTCNMCSLLLITLMFDNLNRCLSSSKVIKSKGVIGANIAFMTPLYKVVISNLEPRGKRGDIRFIPCRRIINFDIFDEPQIVSFILQCGGLPPSYRISTDSIWENKTKNNISDHRIKTIIKTPQSTLTLEMLSQLRESLVLKWPPPYACIQTWLFWQKAASVLWADGQPCLLVGEHFGGHVG